MTQFAAALNKRDREEMAALSGAERIDALERAFERRLLQAETRLAKVEAKLADASGLGNAASASAMALPSSPAADTDPMA